MNGFFSGSVGFEWVHLFIMHFDISLSDVHEPGTLKFRPRFDSFREPWKKTTPTNNGKPRQSTAKRGKAQQSAAKHGILRHMPFFPRVPLGNTQTVSMPFA